MAKMTGDQIHDLMSQMADILNKHSDDGRNPSSANQDEVDKFIGDTPSDPRITTVPTENADLDAIQNRNVEPDQSAKTFPQNLQETNQELKEVREPGIPENKTPIGVQDVGSQASSPDTVGDPQAQEQLQAQPFNGSRGVANTWDDLKNWWNEPQDPRATAQQFAPPDEQIIGNGTPSSSVEKPAGNPADQPIAPFSNGVAALARVILSPLLTPSLFIIAPPERLHWDSGKF